MASSLRGSWICAFRVIVCTAVAVSLSTSIPQIGVGAKETSLNAIELYDGPNGAAYVQIADFTINGKAEVRACAEGEKIDKSAYSKLEKVLLAGATSMERRADGVMTVTRDSAATCVVPANLKLEKNEGSTPAELAELAVVQGRVVSSSPAGVTAPPPLKRGVQIQFVAAPDEELAEYLRAGRAHSIPGWLDYLSKYRTSSHANQAKESLATLQVKEGEDHLAAYRKSAGTTAPAYAELKAAKLRSDDARSLAPSLATALKLRDDVRLELTAITEKGRAQFQAYKAALAGHTPGYSHLLQARELTAQAIEIDPQFDQSQALQTSIAAESRSLESTLVTSENLKAKQKYDDALTAISAYVSFADEEPRISAIVDAAYKFHFEQGTKFASSNNWQDAVRELRRANEIKKTPEAAAALKKDEQSLEVASTRADADAALAKSAAFEGQKQSIAAYEVLADLPPASRALVVDRMQSLRDLYIKSASDEAKILQSAHTPIHGRNDEVEAEHAYDLLERAYSASGEEDKNLKLRLDLLAETISDHYLEVARRYLQKPLGSGVGLAWLYLDLAQQYKSNRDDVRDERTKSNSLYQMRSKLSIRVVFRDQTSRRDSAGFAEQLSDAIATGLETSSLRVRVVRSNDVTDAEPNFRLVGDVLEHRPTVASTVEAKESKYRFSSRDVPNDAWNKANRDYEAANQELVSAQKALEGAQARGKKKEISDANDRVTAAEQKAQDAHKKLDSIPKTNPEDIVKPYSYTKKTIDLKAVVELAFRIVDSSGNVIDVVPAFKKENQRTVIVLENVKPEDTEGVKAQGSVPDEIQYLNDVEIEAREALIKTARDKVEGLPARILEQARKRVQDGDLDGAAESYILYLNATPEGETKERGEGKKFLWDNFNIRWATNSAS
jgi:hypothetical protein